jgi:guanosine-3',5'-bis(diphosphate) 3'-pyrophosphohydrolase
MATVHSTPLEPPAEPDILTAKFAELLATIGKNRPSDDTGIIRRAWEFCVQHHSGQLRASGEPYVLHPLEVAQVLAEMKLDSTAIAAGLLHDAVEDTPVTTEDITEQFGEQVAHIVEGVTKIDKIQFANREDRQAENVRKMLLAMVSDVRVVLIKMADRLHNMRTLQHLPPERQESIARETLDIYAPLAHRLGMGKVRGELEDLAFRYVDPFGYEQVKSAVDAARDEDEQFLNSVESLLNERLRENNIKARVEWRIKRLYSIYQKLQKQKVTVDQVYDLLAVRVITATVQDCYAAFGLIHSIWRPVPGRIKDFIAMPRPNLYQSLHTTVMGEGGHQFEVQIRTEEMHRIAEEGIAAHWKYKAAGSPTNARDEQRLAWVRQLVEWQREMTDPNEFLSTLKIDLYPEEVYTFTPKGKVVVLPKDATPIDFAYSIHTEVGNTCVGAKVNGRMAQLRTKLHNGDIVEVVTQNGHTPSRDWLTFAKSSRARNKIKHWLNEHQRERQRPDGSDRLRQVLVTPGAEQALPGGDLADRPRSRAGQGCRERRHVGGGKTCPYARLRLPAGGRPGRPAGLPGAMLQSHSRRGNCRLCNSRQRRGGACAELPQRAEPALRKRPPHLRGMGADGGGECRPQDDIPSKADGILRRSRRHAEGNDRRHQRRRHQHPRGRY